MGSKCTAKEVVQQRVLKELCTTPVTSGVLNSSAIQGSIESNTFINSAVGRTSSGQEENFILSSRAVMSCNVTGLKEDKV